MEDPEARKARLRAMREQAEGVSQSGTINPEMNATAKLANPFEAAAPTSDAHAPRFNYYSNPAAGFVHTKRKEPGQVPNPHPNPPWRPNIAPLPPPPLYHPQQQGYAPAPSLQCPGDGTWPKRPNFGPPGRGGRGSGPGRGGFPGRNEGIQGRGRGHEGYQGRGRGNDGNQGRGRGRGGGAPASARDHPELFYQKSMVEDPWRHLLP